MAMDLPEYPWFDQVPEGLQTRTQLEQRGLKPAGPVKARVVWRGGRRSADLYALEDAKPKRTLSADQQLVLERGRGTQARRRAEAQLARERAAEARAQRRLDELLEMIARDHAAASHMAMDWLKLAEKAVILDTETTDNPGYVVDLGVLSLDGTVLFDRRFNPQTPIAAGAMAVHGIRDEDVAAAPLFDSALQELDQLLAGRIIIAYNASFDRGVLEGEIRRVMPEQRGDLATFFNWLDYKRWYCAMQLYAEFVGKWNSYWSSYRWKPLPGGRHSAVGDCVAVLELLQSMSSATEIFGAAGDHKNDSTPLQGQRKEVQS